MDIVEGGDLKNGPKCDFVVGDSKTANNALKIDPSGPSNRMATCDTMGVNNGGKNHSNWKQVGGGEGCMVAGLENNSVSVVNNLDSVAYCLNKNESIKSFEDSFKSSKDRSFNDSCSVGCEAIVSNLEPCQCDQTENVNPFETKVRLDVDRKLGSSTDDTDIMKKFGIGDVDDTTLNAELVPSLKSDQCCHLSIANVNNRSISSSSTKLELSCKSKVVDLSHDIQNTDIEENFSFSNKKITSMKNENLAGKRSPKLVVKTAAKGKILDLTKKLFEKNSTKSENSPVRRARTRKKINMKIEKMTPPTDQDKESEIKVLDDKISKIKGENLKALCSKMQENQKIEDKKIKVKNLSKRKKIQPNSAQESPRSELKTLVEKMKLKREERFEKKETEKINKKNS